MNHLHSSLAALGLIENNAPNITAAMLVSPLMGPVMSITFGAIISDYSLIVSTMETIILLKMNLIDENGFNEVKKKNQSDMSISMG